MNCFFFPVLSHKWPEYDAKNNNVCVCVCVHVLLKNRTGNDITIQKASIFMAFTLAHDMKIHCHRLTGNILPLPSILYLLGSICTRNTAIEIPTAMTTTTTASKAVQMNCQPTITIPSRGKSTNSIQSRVFYFFVETLRLRAQRLFIIDNHIVVLHGIIMAKKSAGWLVVVDF